MNSQSIVVVKHALSESKITYFEDQGGMELFFGLTGHYGRFTFNTKVKPCEFVPGDFVIIISSYAELVPTEKRARILEFINEVNSSSCVGNFQLAEDGTLDFRTSIHIPEGQLTIEIVDNLLLANMLIIDNFMPLVTNIIRSEDDSEDDSRMEDIFKVFKGNIAVV